MLVYELQNHAKTLIWQNLNQMKGKTYRLLCYFIVTHPFFLLHRFTLGRFTYVVYEEDEFIRPTSKKKKKEKKPYNSSHNFAPPKEHVYFLNFP